MRISDWIQTCALPIYETALVDRHADFLRVQAIGVRPAADRDDQLVEAFLLLLAIDFIFDVNRLGAAFGGDDLGAEADVEALLGAVAQRFLGDQIGRSEWGEQVGVYG